MTDPRDCTFCKIAIHELPAVVVQEDNDLVIMMDLYPATPGHILILPKSHIEDIYSLPLELGARIMVTSIAVAKAVKRSLRPDGLNLIQANQTTAGQTIHHFHLHIVPRYVKDGVILNFGHGAKSAEKRELERIAMQVRSAL